MDRRNVMGALGAGFISIEQLVAQHQHGSPGTAAKPWMGYAPRFFTATQYAVIDAVCERILPREPDSPGASDVGVAYYLDTLCHYQPAMPRSLLQAGAEALHGKGFAQSGEAAQIEILTALAANERQPRTELERFFVTIKRLTIEAWALSEDGARRGLGYRGNDFVGEFRGCTHDHK
ncbi:MAG: gluconate 2-dehydrogenase subunit 3 family protein [Bryobacteraceae bacterium]|nr:gluconate 2-dehydrogenase subunit 3 family protein [Bryobacteraceae bacterium]